MGLYEKWLALRAQGRRISRRVRKDVMAATGRAVVEPDLTPVTYSYYLREVQALGIQATLLPNAVLRLERGAIVHNLYHSYADLDGEGSLRIAGDKPLCATLLQRAGLPVPSFTVLTVGDLSGALAFQKRFGGDIVIKPADNTGDSLGVCLRPRGRGAVLDALLEAGSLGRRIMVEQFFEGTNYRLLYCNHRFLAAAARLPATVTGDGSRTVRQLVEQANVARLPQGQYHPFDAKPRPLRYRIAMDEDLTAVLRAQNYTTESVPAAGQEVRLQAICHWLRGGEYRDVSDEIHPDLVAAGRAATLATGIKLAGVDVIAKDLHSAASGSFVINEVNTTPGVLVHYEVQNQEKLRPVCREILREMFGEPMPAES